MFLEKQKMNNKNKHIQFLLYIFPIAIFFDFSIGFFKNREFLVIAQSILLFAILFFGIFFNKKIIYNRPSKWILIISFFFLGCVPFSSNIILTLNMLLKFILTSLFYTYSYHYVRNEDDYFRILKFIVLSCIISYFFFAYSTIYEIGRTAYKNQFLYFGYQSLATQFVFCIIFISSFFFRDKIFSKIINHNIFSVITIIILLLSFRRTNFLILLIGMYFLIFKLKIFKSFFIRIIPLIMLVLFVFGDFLLQDISLVLENRERILKVENYRNEGRLLETELAFKSISKSYLTLFFGSGNLFNSANNYGFYSADSNTYTRPIHNDYARILFGSGLIGLLLYLVFLVSIYLNLQKLKPSRNCQNYNLIYNFNLFLIISLFFIGFSSGLTDIFYRIVMMSLIGGGLKLLTLNKLNLKDVNI